LIYEF